jgi:hypothetical protein
VDSTRFLILVNLVLTVVADLFTCEFGVNGCCRSVMVMCWCHPFCYVRGPTLWDSFDQGSAVALSFSTSFLYFTLLALMLA